MANGIIETKTKSECCRGFGRLQCSFLFLFSVCYFTKNVIESLQGPFYPPEAFSKGVSATTYGFVLGSYRLTKMIGTPLFGIYVGKLGLVRCFWIGIILDGLAPILFGLLDLVEDRIWFVTLSFALRALEAAGGVGINAIYIMINVIFPDNVASMVATIKMMGLYGLSIGPLLGSVIYYFEGFTAMFMICGAFQLFACLAMLCVLPKLPAMDTLCHGSAKMRQGFARVLRTPSLYLFLFGALISQMAIEFVQATFQPYLAEQFKLPTIETALAFLLLGSLQLLCVAWGCILDKTTRPEIMILLASLTGITAATLLGPISFLPVTPTFGLTCAGAMIFGLGHGALYVSCFAKLMHEAKDKGLLEDGSGSTILTCCFLTAVSLGGAIGAPVAGLLYDKYGFRASSIFIFSAYAFLGFIVCLYIIYKKYNESKSIIAQASAEIYPKLETTPLLKESKKCIKQ